MVCQLNMLPSSNVSELSDPNRYYVAKLYNWKSREHLFEWERAERVIQRWLHFDMCDVKLESYDGLSKPSFFSLLFERFFGNAKEKI